MVHPNTKHGYFGTRTYGIWGKMVQRCTNPNDPSWVDYGGRGITVHWRWHTFTNFLADMGEAPAGLSLERIDNDKGYEPGNCRWATKKDQARNRRSSRRFEYDGETRTIAEIAELSGVEPTLLRWRLCVGGWPMDRATQASDARAKASPISRYN